MLSTTDKTYKKLQELNRNTVTYLHNLAEKIPKSLPILKSFYSAKFCISRLQTKIHLEDYKTRNDLRCPKCCLKVKDATASYNLKPEPKKSKFAKKLSKKIKNGELLTKFQAKYSKKNNLENQNTLVITCNFCKRQSFHEYNKPQKSIDLEPQIENPKKGKKKKRKDKTCGLRLSGKTPTQNSYQVQDLRKTQNKPISKKKAKQNLIKNITKLNNMLNEKMQVKGKAKNNLNQFLQSL